MFKRPLLFILSIGALLTGCGGGSHVNGAGHQWPAIAPPALPPPATSPPPPPVPPADVAGSWSLRIENNAVNCGDGEFVDAQALVIAQTEDVATLTTSSGATLTGMVNGDIVEWTGAYPDNGGETEFTSASLVVMGDSASGNAAWTWSDAADSCNGTMMITAERDAAFVESGSNSWPAIADEVALVDDVAFITGSLGSGGDASDYFAITSPGDVVIQAELSHFDAAVNNLDLELLDENLQQIAVSSSVDGFEMLEASILAGGRYYVGVIATAGADSYNLTLDVN